MNDETRELIWELSDNAIVRWGFPAAWIVIGGAVLWLSLPVPPQLQQSEVWLVYAPLSVATGVGYVARAAWFRWVAVPAGSILLAFWGMISVAALYPQLPMWWLGILLTLFGLWTVFAGIAGVPSRPVKQRAA